MITRPFARSWPPSFRVEIDLNFGVELSEAVRSLMETDWTYVETIRLLGVTQAAGEIVSDVLAMEGRRFDGSTHSSIGVLHIEILGPCDEPIDDNGL